MVGLLAISPDGRNLVFVAMDVESGRSRLWLRPLAELDPTPMPGTEGAALPFWSPDSQFVGFFADGRLKRTAIAGGAVAVVAQAPRGRGGAWTRRGTILFSPNVVGPIVEVPEIGGEARAVTTLGADTSHRYPHVLPDGRHFLYLNLREDRERSGVMCGDLASPEVRGVLTAASSAAFVRPGFLLLVRGGTLLAQPFDTGTCGVSGTPTRIEAGVGRFGEVGPTGYAAFSTSTEGALVFEHLSDPVFQLTWVDRMGAILGTVGAPSSFTDFALSPDGARVAMIRNDDESRTSDLWLLDVGSGALKRLTADPQPDSEPLWSPDGSRLAFLSLREQVWSVFAIEPTRQNLVALGGSCRGLGSWSPDGQRLAVEVEYPDNGVDLFLRRAAPRSGLEPLLAGPHDQRHPQLSPRGDRLAYTSNESGAQEVYVKDLRASSPPIMVSLEGGDLPQWRADGKELFFVADGERMMSVEVPDGPLTDLPTPRRLFALPVFRNDSLTDYVPNFQVSDNGDRFLVAVPARASAAPITVVLGWLSELGQKSQK